MIEFFVPGLPKTAGSKRAFMRPGMKFPVVVDDCAKSKDWKAVVSTYALNHAPETPLRGPVSVTFAFKMPRPQSHFRTGKHSGELRADAPALHTKKPDALKMARAVEDALTGIMWADDSQICDEHLTKVYSDKPGVLIEVEELYEQKHAIEDGGAKEG